MTVRSDPRNMAHPIAGERGAAKLIILLVLVCAVTTAILLLPIKDYIVAALQWTEGLGIWGPVFVAGFYVVACIFFLPGFHIDPWGRLPVRDLELGL